MTSLCRLVKRSIGISQRCWLSSQKSQTNSNYLSEMVDLAHKLKLASSSSSMGETCEERNVKTSNVVRSVPPQRQMRARKRSLKHKMLDVPKSRVKDDAIIAIAHDDAVSATAHDDEVSATAHDDEVIATAQDDYAISATAHDDAVNATAHDDSISATAALLESQLAGVVWKEVRPAPFTAVGDVLRGMAPVGGGASATLNLAALVNERDTLKRLVNFGVDLKRVARVDGAASLFAACNWARDVEPVLEWLQNQGFTAKDSARILSVFPKIIAMKLDRMDHLLAYLKQHRFDTNSITRMVAEQPTILSLSAVEMDTRLGQIQVLFQFSAADVRAVVSAAPKCVTFLLKQLRVVHACLTKSLCFGYNETRLLVRAAPLILLASPHLVAKNFELLHVELGLDHGRIATPMGGCAMALHAQHARLRQRVEFLRHINRLQLDPEKPLYTAPNVIAHSTVEQFADQLAKRSVEDFILFMKNM